MMKHVLPWLAGLVVLLSALSANAQSGNVHVLPVAQAFQVHVTRPAPDQLVVTWQIADGYYLYRHGFHLSLVDAGPAKIGTPAIPTGRKHVDPYFGPVETYRHHVRIRLPIQGGLAAHARLQVKYQGCADAGLCYPPQTQTLAVPAVSSSGADAGPSPPSQANPAADIAGSALESAPSPAFGAGATTATTPDTSAGLAARLADAPVFATLGLFFILGIGLAFTPCILPMIPIVAGLIGSRDVGRGRALALSVVYVLAMALAYAVFGVFAGYFGANLQAALQRPLVLWPFAGLFILLAGASFGWFDVQMPVAVQSRLSRLGSGRGGLVGAAGLGFAAALIAGPCVAPPLAGALLYISTSGNVAFGGLALFCLGFGMGLPLIALAVFGASVLPRRGAWMGEIRTLFGVLLLAVGLYLGLRLASDTWSLAAWGALALIYAAYLSTRTVTGTTMLVLRRVLVALFGGYAALAAAGLAIGNGRPAAPLAGLSAARNATGDVTNPLFHRVTTAQGLANALAAARAAGRPALVDFYADWCVDCVQMKHEVFSRPAVRRALSGMATIEFDVTAYNADQRRAMKARSVFGPPTLLFFNAAGDPLPDARVTGAINADALLTRLQQITSGHDS